MREAGYLRRPIIPVGAEHNAKSARRSKTYPTMEPAAPASLERDSATTCRNLNRQHELLRFAQSVMATLATVGLVFLFFEPFYDTNDDAAMRAAADGTAAGDPSERLVFISILVGRVLKHLYETWPDFYWYDVYLYGCMVVAGATITYSLLRARTPDPWLPPLFFLGVFWLVPLRPQFTIVAGLCAAASVLLIGSSCFQPPERIFDRIWIALLAATCFVLAILTRDVEAWLVLVVCLLVGGPLLVSWRHNMRWSWAVLSLAGVLVAGVVTVGVSTREAQNDMKLREFMEFNSARNVLHEYGNIKWKRPADRAVLQKVGWTESDLRMLRNWFVTNQEPFTTERLQEIWKLYDRGLLKRPRNAWRDAGVEAMTFLSFYFWLILAAIALILALPARNRGLVVIVWGCVVVVASCIALALHTKAVPYRTSLPLVLGCIALSILSSLPLLGDALGRRSILSTRRPKILGLIVAIIFLVPAWSNTVSHELEVGQIAAVITEDLQAHQPANPHTLYIWWGFYNELAYLSPPFRASSRPTNMVGAGWFLYSPPS